MFPRLESTVFEALEKPLSAISLEVTRVLGRLRPALHVAAVQLELDVDAFARAGRCALTSLPNVPGHARLYADERRTGLVPEWLQAWRKVEWQGEHLELVTLSWSDDTCVEIFHWVLAGSIDVAHRFILEVWNYEGLEGLLVFEHGRFSRSELLGEAIAGVGFDDLVLPGKLATEIRTDAQRFFARRGFYEEHRLPWKRGLLFVGPPGNGKTQTIKALLGELQVPVLYVKSFRARHDDTEENVRRVFQRARRQVPGVLVLEDLDCLIDEHCRSVFLNELDGFAQNTGILVIATTNHPEKLDRSILDRPSRFDRKFHFPLPGEPERCAYLAKWNGAQVPAMRLTDEGLMRVARRAKGFTFAYLKELMLSASLRFVDDDRPGAMDRLASEAVEELSQQMASTAVVLGPLEKSRTIGFAECK